MYIHNDLCNYHVFNIVGTCRVINKSSAQGRTAAPNIVYLFPFIKVPLCFFCGLGTAVMATLTYTNLGSLAMLYASALLRFLHLTVRPPYQGLFPVRLFISDVKDQWATPLP
jgi:hypothetical protein